MWLLTTKSTSHTVTLNGLQAVLFLEQNEVFLTQNKICVRVLQYENRKKKK